MCKAASLGLWRRIVSPSITAEKNKLLQYRTSYNTVYAARYRIAVAWIEGRRGPYSRLSQ